MTFARVLRPVVLAVLAASPALAADPPARLTIPFDQDWRFLKGDPDLAASHGLKDDAWRRLDVPHDWSIEGPFDERAPTTAAGAFLPSGVAWYRKTFALPPESKGKRVFIELDGVMANSEVYVNNANLGSRPNGYVGLRYELTNYLAATGPNVLAVRTDTSRQPASRWYTGAGIYRHVRLVVQDPVHVARWATVVTTPTVAKGAATVHVRTGVVNQSAADADVQIEVTLAGPDGATIGSVKVPAQQLAAGADGSFEADVVVRGPRLWDVADPALYAATVRVRTGGKVVDEETVPFGIRTAEFRADTGFWLNGRNLKLLGVCLHHDAGALGAAVPASAWESRLVALKKLGANAIRTAHNPPSAEFLDLCDRLGLLVMDEAFDAWTVGKEPADYHVNYKEWWRRDLDAMIRRDRNHPSVVIYSLGNEIWDILPQNPDPAADQFTGPVRSIDVAKANFVPMRDLAHDLDPTRPATLAVMRPNVSGAYDNGFADLLDVVGQNYRDAELAAAHVQNPARKILGTEDYKTRETWLALRDNPALAGQFVWAGVDYLGEAGRWPNVVSASGFLDRTNYPRGGAFERESWWSAKPVLYVARLKQMPTRPGRPPTTQGYADWTPATSESGGQTLVVYSNVDSVELFLNDRSLGAKPRDAAERPREWKVPFEPGVVRAVARNKGGEQVVATAEVRTAGPPAKLALAAERATLPNDWDDVAYVRALVTDADGVVNPNAASLVKFTITGPGTIAAVDNGDRRDHDPFQASQRRAHEGTCVAILRANADAGEITLTATADGLAPASVTIRAAPPAQR